VSEDVTTRAIAESERRLAYDPGSPQGTILGSG